MSLVLSRIVFVRESPMRPEVAEGFDLDERVSNAGDSMTCRQGDLTSPDGTPGIDNQLARLLPTVDMMTGGALDGLFQGAINNGQLLVGVTISNVEDRCDDDEVEVSVSRVIGMPFVGSDMTLDPGQTFDLNRNEQVTRMRGRIRNRVLETDPVTLPLPVTILDARFTLPFYGARMRLRFDEEGNATGLIGGGISVNEFIMIASTFNIPMSLKDSVASALRLFADLERDSMGKCQRLSGALDVRARHAFINP